MSSRRRARRFALQGLFVADQRGIAVSEALDGVWSGALDGEGIGLDRPPTASEMDFCSRLALGTENHRERIDALIEEASANWRLHRMPAIDRSVLRLAAFELLECDDIPPMVTINEAVELAKTFGASESKRFVNGLLDRIGRHLGRLADRS